MPAGSLFEVGTGTDSERIRKKLTALCSRKTKNDILEQEKRRHRDENTNDWLCIYHDSLFLDDRLQRCWGWRREYHVQQPAEHRFYNRRYHGTRGDDRRGNDAASGGRGMECFLFRAVPAGRRAAGFPERGSDCLL